MLCLHFAIVLWVARFLKYFGYKSEPMTSPSVLGQAWEPDFFSPDHTSRVFLLLGQRGLSKCVSMTNVKLTSLFPSSKSWHPLEAL